MQNIDIRFNATSNFGAVQAEIAAMKASAQSLASTFATKGLSDPGAVDPARWRAANKAIELASKEYRNAASSSGLFNTQQIRASSEAKRYTDLLRKQKLGMMEMTKHWNIMKEAYHDQLRMQRMTAHSWGTDAQGRQIMDVTMPKQVPAELDNWRNKIGFVSSAMRSASNEMINFGKNTQWAGRQLMVGFTMPVAIFAGVAGTLAYQVDKEMVRIQKVYDSSTDSMIDKERELNNLRTDSMRLAAQAARMYGVAATDTLKVEAELAATGLTGNKLLGSTREVVRIATLGELDFDKSISMTVALQSAFRKTITDGDDLAATFNYLNALENATSLSLQDMTEAIPRAAAGFAQLGGTVKELGVLMTSMKESGIDPATGANALKSASTRIINPVAAAVEFYSQQGIDLLKIRDKSGGNLFEYLKMLGQEQQKIQGPTEKATNLLRAQGVAMLFGTYQNNRLTAALTNTADAYGGVQNQAYRALQVTKMSRKELAALAEGEIAQKMTSASGKFKAAIESIKIQLADMGRPFLEAATDVLGVLEGLVRGFNALPDGAKKFMMWGAIITAIVGPLIMLTGLFFNLAGHVGKGISYIGTFFTKFKLMTQAEATAIAVTSDLNKRLGDQVTVTSTLAMEMQALAASYEKATVAAQNHFAASQAGAAPAARKASQAATENQIRNVMFGGVMPTATAAGPRTTPSSRAEMGALLGAPYYGPSPAPTSTMAGVTSRYDKNGREYFRTAEGKQATKTQISAYRNMENLQKRIAASEAAAAQARAVGAKSMGLMSEYSKAAAVESRSMGLSNAANAEHTRLAAQNMQNTEKATTMGAKSAGVMNVALMGAMLTSGKLQGFLMTASMAMMAFQAAQMTGMTSRIASSFGSGTGVMGKFGKNGTRMFTNLTGAAKTFGKALLGPWGLVAGLAGTALYFIYKKMVEPQRQQEAINRSVQTWADTLGVVEKKYNGLDLSVNNYSDNTVTTREIAEKLTSSDDGKAMVDNLKGMLSDNDDAGVATLAIQEYIKILQSTNATAEDAKRALEAMFLAADVGFIQAGTMAEQFASSVGDSLDPSDYSRLWKQQLTDAFSSPFEELDERASGISAMIETQLASAKNWAARERILVSLEASMDGLTMEEWGGNLTRELQGALGKVGMGDATSGSVLVGAISKMQSATAYDTSGTAWNAGLEKLAERFGLTAEEIQNVATAMEGVNGESIRNISKMAEAQGVVIANLRDQLGIEEKIWSIQQLRATEEWQVASTTKKNVKERVTALIAESKAIVANLGGEDSLFGKRMAAYRVEAVNMRLRRVGMTEISSLNDEINWKQLKQLEKQKQITNEVDRSKQALKAALAVWNEFQRGGWVDAQKSAMSNVMSAVSGAMMDDLSAAQNNELAGADAAAENASNALDARADRVSNHYDNLADRIQKSYDKRIEGINNAIKAEEEADQIRQRLFDREIQRIEQLAAAQNRNIDFNMAINQGNFDEAARIQNDAAAAQVTSAYEDAGEKAERRLEARRERLEKRIEVLEKQRDKRLEAVDKAREIAEKAIDIERDKQAKINEINRQSIADRHEMERAALQRDLDIIMKFIPRNEEQAKKYLDRMAKKYDAFGEAWANGSIKYSDLIDSTMVDQLKQTALELKSNINWAKAGFDAAHGMINGMATALGMSKEQFTKWLGIEINKEAPRAPTGTRADDGRRDESGTHGGPQPVQSNHEGGLIGRGGSGRTGFSGSRSPHSERLVNAKVGEYMVSDKAVRKYGTDTFDAMNDGRFGIGGGTGSNFMLGAGATLMARSMLGLMNKQIGDKVSGYRNKKVGKGVSGKAGAGFLQGSGGSHRVAPGGVLTQGIHPTNAIDIGVGVGSPIYAASDGTVTGSYDIPGYESRQSHGGNGYRSYGRVVTINHGGFSTLYAHLSRRAVTSGQKVKGGARIGYSGNTGNSSGPHLHFGAPGGNPYAFLKTGGTIKYDNTPAILHRDERVLSAPLTAKLDRGLENLNNGPSHVTIDLRGAYIKEDVDIEKAVYAAIDKRDGKVGRKRVIN